VGEPLDRLWAGWRSTYVASAGQGLPETGEGSVFRRILASGLPDDECYIVWRGERVFAILNAFPYTSGHVLVMPYREVPELEDLTREEDAELWATVRASVTAIKAAYRPHGVNVGLNLGEAAGAGVPSHLHVHVLPRWGADSNFITAVAEARVLPEPLSDSWRKLRDAWPGSRDE
jgi:ATP adenylyltransferase